MARPSDTAAEDFRSCIVPLCVLATLGARATAQVRNKQHFEASGSAGAADGLAILPQLRINTEVVSNCNFVNLYV